MSLLWTARHKWVNSSAIAYTLIKYGPSSFFIFCNPFTVAWLFGSAMDRSPLSLSNKQICEARLVHIWRMHLPGLTHSRVSKHAAVCPHHLQPRSRWYTRTIKWCFNPPSAVTFFRSLQIGMYITFGLSAQRLGRKVLDICIASRSLASFLFSWRSHLG